MSDSKKTQKEIVEQDLSKNDKVELKPLSKLEELQSELQKEQQEILKLKTEKLQKFLNDEGIAITCEMKLMEGKPPTCTLIVFLR